MDASRSIAASPEPQRLELECDFLPDLKAEALEESIRVETAAAGKRLLSNVLSIWLPTRLAEAILVQAGLAVDRKAAALSKPERAELVRCIKRLRIPISGTMGFAKAEVTAGGVSLAEVDSRSMESKRVPGLHIAGELLDIDGPIGGFNFTAAFATGLTAGESV